MKNTKERENSNKKRIKIIEEEINNLDKNDAKKVSNKNKET